jgi:outer membrane receptor protein involved in Fe transport
VLSNPTLALAQSVGSITGKVTSSTQGALGTARVTITGAGITRTVETKNDGTFSVDVPPGVYSVVASANGFQASETDNIVVSPGTSATLSFALSNASLTTIGRVSQSSATAVNTTAAAIATIPTSTFTDQGQRTVSNVLSEIPGIEIFNANGGSDQPYSNQSISIRGAEPYESQILIDGHPVNTGANGVDGVNVGFFNSLLLQGVQVSKGPGNMPNTIEDAVGGTVNFQTAAISAKPDAEFLSGYDSFQGFYYSAKLSDTIGKFGFLVGISRNVGPGYLTPQNIYGGDNYYYTYAQYSLPVTPSPYTSFGPGTNYTGVVNFSYPATSDFWSNTQLAKISYEFSPVTSVLFSNYSSQSFVDETGNNIGNVYAKVVCAIPTTTACTTTTPNPNANYTANPYLGLVGQMVPINLYAGYPNTSEYNNQPIYTGEFRTTIGPGSFLARYYAGSVSRDLPQNADTSAISPCYTPSCAWLPYDPANPSDSDWNDNGYPGEPYFEQTTDILHGLDAQYTLPFSGSDYVTVGFDRHVDQAIFQEIYNNAYEGDTTLSDYYTVGPPSATYDTFQSLTESIRAGIAITPKLTFGFGGYFSSATYVGSRFDPRGSLTFKPNSKYSLRASWGSAFVQPYYNLVIPTEKVSGGSLELPTSTFAPETSSSYDVGGDVKLDPVTLLSTDYYFTTIYNRYAEITAPISGTYNGKNYSSETEDAAEGDGVNEGLELSVTRAPKIGLGFVTAFDLLRDYAFNQIVPKSSTPDLFYALPANGVQLPGYPYDKIRAALNYTLADGGQLQFGSTSYGANNSYGQPGFTVFDTNLKFPVSKRIALSLGATNLFNKDDYQVGGIFYGGYTYQTLNGGVGPTNYYFVQPRTVYLQAQISLFKK